MLNDNLKSKLYYLDKLPLFLRNSFGLEEQFELFWKVLIDIDSSIDDIFLALSLTNVTNIDDTLNKIAELVGVKRQLDVSYIINDVLTYFTLNLTNQELLRFIKTRILQNHYIGTFYDFAKNYSSIGFEVLAFDTSNKLEVSLIMNDVASLTNNDKHLFLSGNYTVRSLGITYLHSVQELALLGIWDVLTSTWDNSNWGD